MNVSAALIVLAIASADPAPRRRPSTGFEMYTRFSDRGPTGVVGLSAAYYPIRYVGFEYGIGSPGVQNLSVRTRLPVENDAVALSLALGFSHGKFQQGCLGWGVSPILFSTQQCGGYAMHWNNAVLFTMEGCFQFQSGAGVITRFCAGAFSLLTPHPDECFVDEEDPEPCPQKARPLGPLLEVSIGYAF